jgi:hypothetical protein
VTIDYSNYTYDEAKFEAAIQAIPPDVQVVALTRALGKLLAQEAEKEEDLLGTPVFAVQSAASICLSPKDWGARASAAKPKRARSPLQGAQARRLRRACRR